MSETTESTDTPNPADETQSTDPDETESTDTAETESTEADETESTEADETESTETDESAETTDSQEETSGPDPRLLEELDEHIRGARAAAEDALGDTEHSFVDSGDDRAEKHDDQTIAPPG